MSTSSKPNRNRRLEEKALKAVLQDKSVADLALALDGDAVGILPLNRKSRRDAEHLARLTGQRVKEILDDANPEE